MMTTIAPLLRAGLWAAVGLALGYAHFRGLARTTRAYVDGGVKAKTVVVHTVRMLATAGALLLIARAGAVPLLSAFVGFLGARAIAVRGARRPPR